MCSEGSADIRRITEISLYYNSKHIRCISTDIKHEAETLKFCVMLPAALTKREYCSVDSVCK